MRDGFNRDRASKQQLFPVFAHLHGGVQARGNSSLDHCPVWAERISMVTLFKHLVKVAVSTLLVAVALNWYARHQDTPARFVRRLQIFTALVQADR